MNYKLTLDSNLENEYSTGVATLKRWTTEKRLSLVDANPQSSSRGGGYGWTGSSQRPAQRNRFKPNPKSNTSFREIAAALFPHQDSQKLNLNETNSVAHLLQHLISKNEFFVTANLKDYIADGKRERLKGGFGVIALTPDEAVKVLSSMHGWK